MFLRATREESIIFPKVKLRYSSESPKEMFDEANKLLLNGTSVVLYQNDEASIPALHNIGRTLDEARDYIVFGCWGMDIHGYEKHDDGSYINVVKTLELAVHRDFEKMEQIGMRFEPLDDAKSFEELYAIVRDNIFVLLKERSRVTQAGGNVWEKVDVLPLYSSTMNDCIKNRRDYTQGGARYRDDRNEIFAFGNVVDALVAMKTLCFDTQKYTLKEYLEAVRNNWAGCEDMRTDAINCHGWGDGRKDSTEIGARLHKDMTAYALTLKGTYGGKIYLGYLGYTEIRWWGAVTRATPDGRYDGDYLSQGLSPSRLTRIPHSTDVVRSMAAIDHSLMAGNSVVNIILPSAKMTLDSCEAFLRATAKSAIQSLQLNCTSKETLLDAQKHPEKYPDLVVRVAGFSAKFTSLSPEWQDEFISRNFYES